jgi:hypothetical protein
MTAIATISKTFAPEGSAPVAFVFREDGWFHMTKAANSFGKRLQDFWDNKDAKQYMQALSETIHANQRELFEARAGYNGGTWAHPKLAVFFARWLDVKFAVWCDAMIDDILKGNAEVTITKPELVAYVRDAGPHHFQHGKDSEGKPHSQERLFHVIGNCAYFALHPMHPLVHLSGGYRP